MRPSADPSTANRPHEWLTRRWQVVVPVLALVFIGSVRIGLLNVPLERDEGEYAYSGQLLLQGVPPYELAYSLKFPGTPAAYALIMAVFGQTPAGIHLGVLCVTTMTALLLFALGRELIDSTAGLVAATAYAFLAAAPSMFGLAGHATHFAALFAIAGFRLMLAGCRSASGWRLGLSGFLFGLAVLMKQHAIFFCIWGLGILAAKMWNAPAMPTRRRLWALTWFGAGVLLPLLLTCLLLWRAGVFGRFRFWTVSYAAQYATALVPPGRAPEQFLSALRNASFCGLAIWILGGAGLVLMWFDRRLRENRWMLFGFFMAALLTTVPGFLFREHYFLLVAPAIGLLAGGAISTARKLWSDGSSKVRSLWPVWIYGIVLAITVLQNRTTWFQLSAVDVSRRLYPQNPFVEAEDAAEFVRTNSPPGSRIAVLGSEPEVYFLSHRRSATGYIYMYPLMEPHAFAHRMQTEMIREIESVRPQLILHVPVAGSWLRWPNSDRTLLDWWTQSYQTNYDLTHSVSYEDQTVAFLIYRRKEGR